MATELGVSFSLHRCSELGLDKHAVLEAALSELGVRRFRLMSYWNIHEPSRGEYNFDELDWQMNLIAKYKGTVSLALGVRQPRWPEWHVPNWAAKLESSDWYEALYKYIEAVVHRYKDHPALISWQLENEALLKTFGTATDYNRKRLQHEHALVRKLDPNHPLIMTLSDSWGLPWLGPRPDMYGMSLYRFTFRNGVYHQSHRPALFYALRRALIHMYSRRPSFIHELQAEPWLHDALTKVPVEEQLVHMNPKLFKENLNLAKRTGMRPLDLWGLEWWYWLRDKHGINDMWEEAQKIYAG